MNQSFGHPSSSWWSVFRIFPKFYDITRTDFMRFKAHMKNTIELKHLQVATVSTLSAFHEFCLYFAKNSNGSCKCVICKVKKKEPIPFICTCLLKADGPCRVLLCSSSSPRQRCYLSSEPFVFICMLMGSTGPPTNKDVKARQC